jgi:anti-repressor protein
MARAILLAQSTMERQRAQIDELAPKAFFADAVASSDTLILVRDLAHVLAQNGLGIGQNRLFALLRKDGYLEQHRNEATQKSIELGVMRMTSGVYMGADGNSHTKRTAKVTGKGQQYFVARYCGKGVA